MGMEVTGDKAIQNHFKKVGKSIVISQKHLTKVVSEARNRIRKRTNKGQTSTGGSFKPLDPLYRKYKVKKGKKAIPDLHFEGGMLNAMSVKSISKGAEMYFNDVTQRIKAEAHNFGRGVPRRTFFRLGKKIRKYIFDEFRKPIKKAVK